MGRDALAVFDVSSPGSRDFGKLVAFLPVGSGAKAAHHTNYSLPPNDVLYANDWKADLAYVFNLNDPRHPKLVRHFGNVGPFSYPHTFVYLPNGNTLATLQYAGGFNKGPGGLVEFDPNIRPYSIAVSAKLDRVVTSNGDVEGAQYSHVAQMWRSPISSSSKRSRFRRRRSTTSTRRSSFPPSTAVCSSSKGSPRIVLRSTARSCDTR
jgi:hypothetical protein